MNTTLKSKTENTEIKYIIVPPLEEENLEYVIPSIAYYNLVSAIPKGMVCTYDDLINCLRKAYGIDSLEISRDRNRVELYINDSFPYWRVVSQRGYLNDNIYCSRETHKKKLEADGIKVVQIGEKDSFRVDEFEHSRFDVNCFKITVMKTEQAIVEQFVEQFNEIKKAREQSE